MTHTDYQEASPRHARVPGRVRAPRLPLRQPGHEPDRPVAGSRHLRARRVRAAALGRRDAEPQPRLSGPPRRHLHRAGRLTPSRRSIRAEKVDLVIDLHEASPEYPVVNAIVAHERAMPVASAAVLNLEFDDITIGLEPSPKNLRGLSHRELGDATGALAMLCETSNVSQGRLRGATDARQVIEGTDDKYLAGGRPRPARRAVRREGMAPEAARRPPRRDRRGDPRRVHVHEPGDADFGERAPLLRRADGEGARALPVGARIPARTAPDSRAAARRASVIRCGSFTTRGGGACS